MICHSRYLAQNAASWLAVEVLRYRDHDTSRCQDDISWHLIRNNRKDVTLTMVCVLLWETASLLIFILERYLCQFHNMFSDNLLISTNFKLQRLREICSGPRPVSWWDHHELDKSCLRLTLVFDSCKTKEIVITASWHWTRTRTYYSLFRYERLEIVTFKMMVTVSSDRKSSQCLKMRRDLSSS